MQVFPEQSKLHEVKRIKDSFVPLSANNCQKIVYALSLGHFYPVGTHRRKLTRIGKKRIDKSLDLV